MLSFRWRATEDQGQLNLAVLAFLVLPHSSSRQKPVANAELCVDSMYALFLSPATISSWVLRLSSQSL